MATELLPPKACFWHRDQRHVWTEKLLKPNTFFLAKPPDNEGNLRYSLAASYEPNNLVSQGNDHGAASSYYQLGRIAEEQRDFSSAKDSFLAALKLLGTSAPHETGIVLRSLSRLVSSTKDTEIVDDVASALGMNRAQVEELLKKLSTDE